MSEIMRPKVAPPAAKAESGPEKPDLKIKGLSPDQIDKLDSDALRAALKSVLRAPGATMLHKDHRSFSSSSD